RSVIVCLWCQESNVRLGLAVSKLDRVLNTDDGLGAKQAVKQSVETFDTRGVLLPDGQFGNNLPTDEFDPVILIEDAVVDHLLVKSHRETVRRWPGGHGNRLVPCQAPDGSAIGTR